MMVVVTGGEIIISRVLEVLKVETQELGLFVKISVEKYRST